MSDSAAVKQKCTGASPSHSQHVHIHTPHTPVGTHPPPAARSSIIASRLAATPFTEGRRRLPRISIPTAQDPDSEDDDDENGPRAARASPYFLKRARACAAFAIQGMPPSLFPRLLQLLDPGPWWQKVIPEPELVAIKVEGATKAAVVQPTEEEKAAPTQPSTGEGKKKRALTLAEEEERRQLLRRMERAEAVCARRVAEEAEAREKGKGKGNEKEKVVVVVGAAGAAAGAASAASAAWAASAPAAACGVSAAGSTMQTD